MHVIKPVYSKPVQRERTVSGVANRELNYRMLM